MKLRMACHLRVTIQNFQKLWADVFAGGALVADVILSLTGVAHAGTEQSHQALPAQELTSNSK